MFKLVKIVSGGQTGVDRGALEAAHKAGFPYGGFVPAGRLAEDGAVPEKFVGMVETPSQDYRVRTRLNAENSTATLILDFAAKPTGGTQRTIQYCQNAKKPFFAANPSLPDAPERILAWLERTFRPKKRRRKTGGDDKLGGGDIPVAVPAPAPLEVVLNVAGPRESKEPGIALATEHAITRLLALAGARAASPR